MTNYMQRDTSEPRDARHDAAAAGPSRADVVSKDPARRRRRRGMTPSTVETMRLQVEQRMSHGERFTDVEDLIDASDLSAEEKSALWLLAWSYVHPRAQRREANAHLCWLTAATPPPAINHARPLRVVR
jgi:hypothetical protein